jgi:hypothetical protein
MASVAVGAIVTAPGVAKSRTRHYAAPAEVRMVIQAQGNKVPGADPEPRFRLEMRSGVAEITQARINISPYPQRPGHLARAFS